MTEPYSEVQMFPLLEELASVVDEPENQQDDIVDLWNLSQWSVPKSATNKVENIFTHTL